MTTEVFFNKPVRPFDITKLFSDMRLAQNTLIIASAWFTDTEIARVFIESRAKVKRIILNTSDVERGSKRAYEMIKDWDDKLPPISSDDDYVSGLTSGLTVLGSGDWKEGVMHHKFVLIDCQIVWAGSYNMTYQARNNYETILRIQDKNVGVKFFDEVLELCEESMLFSGGYQFSWANGAFRCAQCDKLLPNSAVGDNHGSWLECVYCKRERQ